ncbi:uncharacterized protein MONBRDRAFT_33759 [Monosiga brevicollis MX1]|uniref:CN hydrolase domain-containing protein n=1 Tax=Monosiga brevicollis TaxID=81824 RepID=A9V7A5_MONBE|nr:uncharacterized protein MONBRDRAFT_33759 [Monosiga brevicollis MX1]EDQ86482.1 predicted protein [Monosiga brevicollis MX1]|eukprot:XP_001748595.1 hypothetical protein [Monosiga brevicollis MX1]
MAPPMALMMLMMMVVVVPVAAGLRVAAVQHTVVADDAGAPQWTNLPAYFDSLQAAGEQGVEVVVFPEFGLFGPDFDKSCSKPSAPMPWCLPLLEAPIGALPCTNSSWNSIVRNMSCHVREANLTAMFDVCETANNGTAYNTALVFGPDGAIVTAYRKMHPWFENCFAAADNNEITLRFPTHPEPIGIFVCKDILYKTPGPELVAKGIKTFLYTVALSVVGAEAVSLWSKEYNATVVSSNLGLGQSGVFRDGQRLTPAPSSKPGSDVLVIYDL